jgi:hypothetical protein
VSNVFDASDRLVSAIGKLAEDTVGSKSVVADPRHTDVCIALRMDGSGWKFFWKYVIISDWSKLMGP